MKAFPEGDTVANVEARDLSLQNLAEYRKRVEDCVTASQKAVFVNTVEGCTAKFSEEEASHEILRELMHQNLTDPSTLTRTQVLEMVQEASERAAREQAA